MTQHGAEPQRGQDETPRQRAYSGRFGRLFQSLAKSPAHDPESPEDDRALMALAETMVEGPEAVGDNHRIPAGYVYLGQFVDHDITSDTASQLQRRNDPTGLINFRTPRFDLDSVYGRGPTDDAFAYDSRPDDPSRSNLLILEPGPDMPRNRNGRALIGDPRNDENGIVSQLHVAFMSLHNRLVEKHLGAGLDPELAFSAAQRDAQWHFQWIVVHDFLPRVIGDEIQASLLVESSDDTGRRTESVRLSHYRHKVNPYIPVEFSVAAYRFGHSQVRETYSINSQFTKPLFSTSGDDFRGFQPLRPGWQASWPFFFSIDQAPQASRLIDTSLAPALSTLQGGTGELANLALRNLRRGAALGLPSGEAVAQLMGVAGLTPDEVGPAEPGRTPLWFYILREAQLHHSGEHLGAVGGRIVGETLLGLLRADPQSYLSLDPAWVPDLPARSGPRSFDMVDLLAFAVPEQIGRF